MGASKHRRVGGWVRALFHTNVAASVKGFNTQTRNFDNRVCPEVHFTARRAACTCPTICRPGHTARHCQSIMMSRLSN